ncbi:MAG: Uncharacterized protein AUK63_1611 [bacterium P3]|nr:MAG: Uncharacterized protein AUK63_1611 [bacterium P3]KWW38989.1 MAG: Uncharacterized protein F083_1949 [bacterium F083]
MKKQLARNAALCLALCTALSLQAQQPEKQERKRNLVVREYNIKEGSTKQVLDNVTIYDAQGRKVEEIEYASYGQKKRSVYKYNGNSRKCHEEVEYNDKNHVTKIKRFEYNDDGTKKRQYNYSPKGQLLSTKEFEYSYK